MANITYADKVENSGSTAEGRLSADDANEIKTVVNGKQDSDSDLTAIAALTPSNDDILQRKSGAWTNRTVAQVKTDLALNNVDNTSDVNKPVSTAQQTALDLKVDKETFTSVTFADPLVLDCGNKQNPLFKTTVTSAFTIDLQNVKNGRLGVILLTITPTTSVIVTFDAGFTNEIAGVFGSVVSYELLAGTSGRKYLLQFIVDGTTLIWSIYDNSVEYNLTGDVVSTTEGITTIQPQSVTFAKMQNIASDKVIGRVGTSGSPQEISTQPLIISDSVIINDLLDNTTWSGATKVVSGILAPSIYRGTSVGGADAGVIYEYTCTVNGTAQRKACGTAVKIDTLSVKTPVVVVGADRTLSSIDHTVGFNANATCIIPSATTFNGYEFLIICLTGSTTVTFSGTVNGVTPTSLTTQYSFLRIKAINNIWVNIS